MMKVKNMISRTSGREVANQFIITDGNKITFQSYSSPIVEIDKDNGKITVFEDWDYSKTTGKYRNQFMYDFLGMMDSKKDFEHFMNIGKVGSMEIIKAF